MKFTAQWKDPDWYDGLDMDSFSEKDLDAIRELGIGEYLLVEVDTEAKTAIVVGNKSL